MHHFVSIYFLAWITEKLSEWYPHIDHQEGKDHGWPDYRICQENRRNSVSGSTAGTLIWVHLSLRLARIIAIVSTFQARIEDGIRHRVKTDVNQLV